MEYNSSLDWHLLESPAHAGIQHLLRDLNGFYRNTPELYQKDCRSEGFDWIDCSDIEQGVIAFIRRVYDGSKLLVSICNVVPVIRHDYRIGVPIAGCYLERLNTDAKTYGGSGVGNLGKVNSDPIASHGHENSLNLVLPPLTTLILTLN